MAQSSEKFLVVVSREMKLAGNERKEGKAVGGAACGHYLI